ncbi:hypothetical protein GHT09_007997 [Marmota monax]|uniref:Uncharacterized protein n=1 Tax=Marmota monax TaxID=9995 RepID=A0A834V225_MARMO|nr:hypothetical protein GHT09_007997 [Marmota monax]
MAVLYKVLDTFLFGAAMSPSLMDLAKYMISCLGPKFLAICNPNWSWVNCSVYEQLERTWLCGKWARLLWPTVQFFLVAFALYVGYTHLSDHKYHCRDVLVCLLPRSLEAGITFQYVSDFFKARPPHPFLEEAAERKPSL